MAPGPNVLQSTISNQQSPVELYHSRAECGESQPGVDHCSVLRTGAGDRARIAGLRNRMPFPAFGTLDSFRNTVYEGGAQGGGDRVTKNDYG